MNEGATANPPRWRPADVPTRAKHARRRVSVDLREAVLAACRWVGAHTPDEILLLNQAAATVPRDALVRYLARFGVSPHPQERLALLHLLGRVIPMDLSYAEGERGLTVVIKSESGDVTAIQYRPQANHPNIEPCQEYAEEAARRCEGTRPVKSLTLEDDDVQAK